jgi:ABC-type spermidine/putrescine transport system permease subunit I
VAHPRETAARRPPRPGVTSTGWIAPPAAWPWLLLAPSLLTLLAFFVLPILWLVRLSLFERDGSAGFYVADSLTLRHYAALLTDRYFHNLAWTTLRLGAIVTVLAMTLAYPLAVYLYRAGPTLKLNVLLAVLLPKFTNILVAMYGVLALLASSGPINRFLLWSGLVQQPLPMFANLFAVVVGETLIITPYPVLILASALHGVDRQLEDAARGLGASGWRAFYEVTFKLTLPSALLAALVTLIWALGAFTAPVVLGNPELYPIGVEVYTTTFEDVNWPLGAALAVTNLLGVLVLALGALGLHRALERGR